MAKLISEQVEEQIKELFGGLKNPVKIFFFGQKSDCDYCDDTRQMVEEVSALSDLINFSVHDLEDDAGLAQQYKVDKAPGLVLAGQEGEQILDYGIRFAGIPSGHEFSSLIHDIVLVSNRDSGLNPQTRELLKGLSKPVHLQVFVTPT